MNRWGMVVDLNRCVGCQTCTIACKQANDTPPGVQWRRVLDIEQGRYPDVERVFLVVGCQHCANPPCVPVCPTGATRQRADGLVTMDYDTCIGCAYCAVACPYQARTIVHDPAGYYGAPTAQEARTVHADRIGVANKCTFCVERIDDAAERGLIPGVDLEVTPACAASCISQAIRFGDFADPGSTVSGLVRDNASFQMHAELGTDPQIKYLYEVPNTTPGRAAEPADLDDDTMSDPANPLAGARQTFWDYRAAMNFILGGMSSGLAVMAYLAHLVGGMPAQALLTLYLAAAAGMAVGLFFVFLKIGRKARFLNVLKRPQSSWMTRETYFVAAFYPAVAADFIWPQPALHLLVALSALGFLVSQAFILFTCKGIPAWRAPLIPPMLVAMGLFEGVGLLAIAAAAFPTHVSAGLSLPLAGLALALVNAGLWHRYRTTARTQGIGPIARWTIRSITPWLQLVGHANSAVIFSIALLGSTIHPLLLANTGFFMALTGAFCKYFMIVRAGYQQGYALPMMPQRGSGTRAAPAKLDAA
jgi:phenylacetyl-CoA:acceptor oxidoreductase subunit 1